MIIAGPSSIQEIVARADPLREALSIPDKMRMSPKIIQAPRLRKVCEVAAFLQSGL